MAESKGKIEEGQVTGPPIVQSTTTATPSPADETPIPNHLNTETEQPPVRSAKAGEKLAQTLAAGAGEHTPPDPDEFGPDGRPKNPDAGEAPRAAAKDADGR